MVKIKKTKFGLEHLIGGGVLAVAILGFILQRAEAAPEPGPGPGDGPNTLNVIVNDETVSTLFF